MRTKGVSDGSDATSPRRIPLHGEEDTTPAATPLKDLIGATIIGALAVAAMALSLGLENPERVLTAPGLLPFITGLALLLMAIALGLQAVRGGAARGFFAALGAAARSVWSSAEDRRAALLGGLVFAYVFVVAQLGFELRVSTPIFDFLVTGFELISIVVITAILKLFWRASVLRCVVVAVVAVETLALSFRYGFNLIMPEAF
jgi:hypothetical protein